MSQHIRIGCRLFNLDYITSMEARDHDDDLTVDVHIVAGRKVRLTGDDAMAAVLFIESIPALPTRKASQDQGSDSPQAAQDCGGWDADQASLRIDETQA